MMEQAVIKTVESGKMTKDLAMCISGGKSVPRSAYRSTQEFMQDISDTFRAMWTQAAPRPKL